MAAITPTLLASFDASAGNKKIKIFAANIGSASDTIDLSSYFSTIYGAEYKLTAGRDAALQTTNTIHSGTTLTVTSQAAAGTAATDWTGATGQVIVFGEDEGI